MSDYRRYFVPGGTYFFTLVTERRARLFRSEAARILLGDAIRKCQEKPPFKVIAMVLLPDHLHALWELPPGDDDFPLRWKVVKRDFTMRWLAASSREQPRNRSRIRERRRGIWQRRYWEHTIDDETDLEHHFDYIHYNPAKHKLARRPRDWPASTFHRYVESGHYDINWGAGYIEPDLPEDAGEWI